MQIVVQQLMMTCICSPEHNIHEKLPLYPIFTTPSLLPNTLTMSLTTLTIQDKPPYYALPTYDPSTQGLTALITGANGISGFHLTKVLAAAPERWKKLHCLSRKPPADYFWDEMPNGAKGRVEHVSVDFLAGEEELVKTLGRMGRM